MDSISQSPQPVVGPWMKKKKLLASIALLSVFILAVICAVSVSSSDDSDAYINFEYNGVVYTAESFLSTEATVTGCNRWYSESIMLPQYAWYNARPYSVTSIAADSFTKCEDLHTIIGYSIVSIDANAFNGYSSLRTVRFDALKSIGDSAFQGCKSLTSVTIPSVTTIGKSAFQGCTSLTSVTIPGSVTTFGDSAFQGCTSLTSVTIPGSITSFGSSVYYGCTSLTSVNISSSVTYLGISLFHGCKSLKSVIIPNSVTTIGESAFRECTGLTTLVLPDSNLSICEYAFSDCTSLAVVTLHSRTVSIGGYAFCDCTSLKSVTIPDSVTTLGDYAFYGCTSLVTATVGNNVTEIENGCFGGCTALYLITVGGGVSKIGDLAFTDCTTLTVVKLNNVEMIGQQAFVGCNSLAAIEGSSVTSICEKAFYGCSKLQVIRFNDVESIGDSAFQGCTYLTSVTIPDSTTSVGDYAFRGCTSVSSAIIGENVITIGAGCFYDCRSLATVTIGSKVISIGDYAFYKCTPLASVILPSGLKNIGSFAFYCCTSLDTVTIPDSTKSIGSSAFYGCTSIKSAAIPDGVTSLGGYAFYGCTSLASVTIGYNITMIETGCFGGCISLNSVALGANVSLIGNYAFLNCAVLPAIKFTCPTSICEQAFYGCTSLTVTVVGNVPSLLEGNAFYGVQRIYVPSYPVYSAAPGWSNYTDIMFEKVNLPTAAAGITYDGSSHKAFDNTSGKYVPGVNYEMTDAGTYEVGVTPNDHYCWSDDTTGSKTLSWSIAKREISLSVKSIPVITYDGSSKISSVQVATDLSENLTAACTAFSFYAGSYAYASSAAAGKYTVEWSDGTAGTIGKIGNYNVTVSSGDDFVINPAPLTVVGKDIVRTYNAELQCVSIDDLTATGLLDTDHLGVTYSGTWFGVEYLVPSDYQIDTIYVFNGETNVTSNYSITKTGTWTFQIDRKEVTLSWGTSSFVYDGTVHSVTAAVVGVESGDESEVNLDYTNNSSKSVCSKTATASLTGSKSGNYVIKSGDETKDWNVTKRDVLITNITVKNKVYDGTTSAEVQGTPALSWKFETDDVSATFGTAEFSAEDAGQSIPIIFTGCTLSGADKDNYNLTGQSTAYADITPRPVTISGITVKDKVYDGTTAAEPEGTPALSWKFETDDVSATFGSATFSSKDVGTSISVALVCVLEGSDKDNYNIAEQPTSSADITPRPVTITGITVKEKVYDGTTTAEVQGTPALSWKFEEDDVSVTSGTAAFPSKNVGSSISVLFTGYALSGADKDNYNLTAQPTASADITPRSVSVTGITVKDKVYDGTTSAEMQGTPTLSWKYEADDVSATFGTAEFSSENVGTDVPIIFTGCSLSGTDKGNYNLTGQSTAYADITPRPVTISGITVKDKVYDGTTSAEVQGTPALSWKFETDDVSATFGSVAFSSKDVGTSISVALVCVLEGSDKDNYNIAEQPTSSADITLRPVTITGITVKDKVYDGTTSAEVQGTPALSWKFEKDDVSVTSGTAAFPSKDVGSSISVIFTGYALSGADKDNYNLTAQPTASADITPRPVMVTNITVKDKVYDGTTSAELEGTPALSWKFEKDDVTATFGTAEFSAEDSGQSIPIIFTGCTLSGVDKDNYNLTGQSTAYADITPRPVTISGITVKAKVYDGTTAAEVQGTPALSWKFETDDVYAALGTAAFSSKNVGSSISVVLVYDIDGPDKENYILSEQPTASADITLRPVTIIDITIKDKVYDGTTSAEVQGTPALSWKFEEDDVSVTSGTAAFPSKDVGSSISVIFTGYALSGADKDNYNLTAQPTASADITLRPVIISGITVKDKVYDGTVAAELIFSGAVFMGLIDGDSLSASSKGSFENPDAGAGKNVTITDLTLGGSSVGNYILAAEGQQTFTTAEILRKEVMFSGITAEDKTYDAGSTVLLDYSGLEINGIVGKESLILIATGNFSDCNVGTGKTVVISDVFLSGEFAKNYKLAEEGCQTSTVASITPATVIFDGIIAKDKQYDRTVKADLDCSHAVLFGVCGTDKIVIEAVGTFENSEVGTGKTVVFSNVVITGEKAGNYVLLKEGCQTEAEADITPRVITNAEVRLGPSLTYTGKEQLQTVESVTIIGLNVTYTVTDNSATDAGTYELKIIGNGNFTGEVLKQFTVAKVSNKVSITFSDSCVDLSYEVLAEAYGTPEFRYKIVEGNDIASVDSEGTITAKAVGKASLKVTALEQKNYLETSESFEINVYEHDAQPFTGTLPTATEPGHTGGHICVVCRTILEGQKEMPATGTDTTSIVSTFSNSQYYVPESEELKGVSFTLNDGSADSRTVISLSGASLDRIKDKVVFVQSKTVSGKEDTFSIDIIINDDGEKEFEGEIYITVQYDRMKGIPSIRWVEGDEKMNIVSINDDSTVTFMTTHNSTYQIEYSRGITSPEVALCLWGIVAVLGIVMFAVLIIGSRPEKR